MLKNYARKMRKSKIDAEIKIWQHLRNRRLAGFKFTRQYWIRNYIVDFICLEKKLIIELDGSQHAEEIQYDAIRTIMLNDMGFKVLRFWNNEIFENVNLVLDVIYRYLTHPHPPSAPSPASRRRKI